MTILYCGPYQSEYAIRESPAVSQAAVRWSVELISALRALGHEVIVVSHCPMPLWPKGKVVWQGSGVEYFWDELCTPIGYPNVPLVRTQWLNLQYGKVVRREIMRRKIDAFICYNSLHPYHVSAMHVARQMGVPCYPIILDGDDPRKDEWRKMLRDNRFASGIVFLSYWLTQHYPQDKAMGGSIPILHLDGGSVAFNGVAPSSQSGGPSRIFTVVHTGSLNKERELRFIAKALKCYQEPDTRFVFTGKCDRSDVIELCGNDKRIEVKGFVSIEELNRICREADAFLNIRVPEHCDNVVNFPSKLPQSLSWGRPVISTWVDSFSPDYRNVLCLVDDNTPEGLATCLKRVKLHTYEQRVKLYELQKTWFLANKTWKAQAVRLVDWISSLK